MESHKYHWWLVSCLKVVNGRTEYKEGYTTTTPDKNIRPADVEQWKDSVGMKGATTIGLCYMGEMTKEAFFDGCPNVTVIEKPHIHVVK